MRESSSTATPTAGRSTDKRASGAAQTIIAAKSDDDKNDSRPRAGQQAGPGAAHQQSQLPGLVSQLYRALYMLAHRFFLPLLLMIARDAFGSRQNHAVSDRSSSVASPPNQPSSASAPLDDGNASFIEKFKYIICSSFLLTPTLSISFYESHPPGQTQSPTNGQSINGLPACDHVQGRRASPTSISRRCYVEPCDAPAADVHNSVAAPQERLPRLDTQGRLARNASLLSALFLLPPVSASWRLYLSSLLPVACLTWSFILLLDHSSYDDKIEYTLSRQPKVGASASPTSLRNLSTTNDLNGSEKLALQAAILRDVSALIKTAQSFDVAVNKAIRAIQEVETVSRGYKLTHPLPPISRIEAASSWSNVTSPSAQRRSLAVSSGSTNNGKLARTLSSGGNGAPTTRRHTQRPLSLNLSSGRMSPMDRPSGRASPAVSSEVGDLDHQQKMLMEQGIATLAHATGKSASQRAPQRLVQVRKALVAVLEGVGASFTSSNADLHLLADAEELAMLHELYALDAGAQDDDDEADASHAWPNGDTSAFSEGSPDLEHDRKVWVATTPRNFGSNVRSADLSGYSDTAWRPDSSPFTGSVNPKRLSLVSDAGSVLDRHPRASSSLSRRSSLVSESGKLGAYRSPRLNYVTEQATGASGPNESAAAKRLSYVSTSNSSFATGSFDTRSPGMRNSSVLSSTFSPPPHSSAQTYSATTSPQSRATKRSSILGANSIFAHLDPSTSACSAAKPADPLSLLNIKAKFEWMHRARRRWLCHLLALNLNMSGLVSLSDGESLPYDEYWAAARSTIGSARSTLRSQKKAVTDVVNKEMGLDFLQVTQPELPAGQGDESGRGDRLAVPSRDTSVPSVVGHPGIEDRLHAMMLSLRSLQAKIRVCAEDIRVKAPAGLHGVEDGQTDRNPSQAVEAGDDAGITMQLERTIESMRDDLLGLSAEWEATIKLIQKEKHRSPSPHLSTDVEVEVSKSNAARELVSPLEADEDAAGSPHAQDGRLHRPQHDVPLPLSPHRQAQDGHHHDASDDEDDSELAALLLNSTSPDSLPPPGLEQVFESIAGMAGLSGLGAKGPKLSRAERIEQARLQRQQQEQESRAEEKASHRHTLDPSGMMSELNDVISTRKAVREQRHQSALPLAAAATTTTNDVSPAPSSESQPALALGSPLDLGSAGCEGVFGASHSFVDDQAMPRRSLSSLDLARARALQALEARSPSAASSSASNSFDSGDESRQSDDFSFEPTPLESVPEDAASNLAAESPSTLWDSASRKSTPKASQVPLSSTEATPIPDSPFDLGAQVAAYARRKKAAKARAAAMQVSGSESSMSSHFSA